MRLIRPYVSIEEMVAFQRRGTAALIVENGTADTAMPSTRPIPRSPHLGFASASGMVDDGGVMPALFLPNPASR
jgi:hypothetical protein